MKLNCVSCGHAIDLRDAYDNYDGQVKCFACGALLAVRTHEGEVKWVECVATTHHHDDPSLQSTR
jgi:hypothetical protein